MTTINYTVQSKKTYASEKLAAARGKQLKGDQFLRTSKLPSGRFCFVFTLSVSAD